MADTADNAENIGNADKIIDATMALLADRRLEDVTVRAIAEEADVSLAELNAAFATRGEILDAFSRRIDQIVLAAEFSDMAGESPRDRLFDVLMSRLDALAHYKDALKSLMAAAQRDPGIAMGLNAISMRSQSWMLAAAGLSASGWRGGLAVQGLVIAFAKVLRTFLDEDDPGLPRTMAKLDRELHGLQERHQRLSRIFGTALRSERGARAKDEPSAAATPAATTEAVESEPPSAAPTENAESTNGSAHTGPDVNGASNDEPDASGP
ncbi:MAG: helix-turn-helix domain-containing protein [Pseudomonadota bacterium]